MSHRRSVIVGGLSVCALVASTSVAFAHAQYQSSTPAANATLSAAPSSVQVTWTQEINAIQFTITGPDGSDVAAGPARIDLEQRHNASVPLRAAGPGQYLVLWHNVSDEDGDPNDGSFVFSVAGALPTPTPGASGAVATASATAVSAPTPSPASGPTCIDHGQVTPGLADFRVNTYCKRQAIRDQYRGKINELVFNYDLSIGMGLENSLKDAMGQGGSG